MAKKKIEYVVDYDYREGGSFVKRFSSEQEARALCIELMMTPSIVWVQGLANGRRFFPGN